MPQQQKAVDGAARLAARGCSPRVLAGLVRRCTSPTLLPPIYFDDPHKAAFFFGEPLKVCARIWDWFSLAATSTRTSG